MPNQNGKWKMKLKKEEYPPKMGGNKWKKEKKNKKKGLTIKPKKRPNIKGIGEAEGGWEKKALRDTPISTTNSLGQKWQKP